MINQKRLSTQTKLVESNGDVGSRKGRSRLLPALLAFVMIAGVFLAAAPTAKAVHNNGAFELGPGANTDEGGKTNILDDGNAANGPDWAALFDANGGLIDPSKVAVFIKDDTSQAGATDKTTFSGAGGSNKNNDPISGAGDTWHWDEGNVPAKDDFANGYAYATFVNSHLVIYAGFERLDPSGDSHVDMEFFHDHVHLDEAVPCNDPGNDPTPCAWVGTRTIGDIIATMDFLNGGGFGTLTIYEWSGSSYTQLASLTGEGCNPASGGIPADSICGFNNGGSINGGPWPNYDRHGKVITTLQQNSFTEFGIDVTNLEGFTPCISTVLGKTRSSQSFTAELKDFAGPASFPLCSASIQIHPDDVNEVGQSHTYTVWVNQTVAGVSGPAADGTIVTVMLTASNGAVVSPISDNCATGIVGGKCTVTFTSMTPGLIKGHASATVQLLGQNTFVETDGAGQNSGDATKRFVDARIAIAPDDVNRVGETHTFTVTVTENAGLGAGWVAAAGEHVDFTLTNSLGALAVLNAAASTCDNVGPNTDVNGQCTIVFTSNSPGLVTGHASSSVQVGGLSVFRQTDGLGGNTGDANKRFVDARIGIAPDDINEVGQTHTFIVTVQKDAGTGAGFVGASGEHVSFTLTDANGAVDIIDTGTSTCDDLGPNTDGSGMCTIVFTSNIAGIVTGHASASVHVGGLVIAVATDNVGGNTGDAHKRFVDAFILIGPDDTNGIGELHTFTVRVRVDDGGPAGILAAPDGTVVAVTLTDSNGAIDTVSGDTCASGTSAGTCSVTFTSASAGTVTGHASVDVLVMGVTLHRETDNTHGSSGDAVKVFIAGSIAWTKVDNVGRPQGGATFQVCLTALWNSDTSSFDPITPQCMDVTDNSAPDVNSDDGAFLLVDLVLGRYTVHETTAPPGYVPDPRTETVELSLTSPDASIALPFVNQRPILKLTGFGYTNTPTGIPGDGVVSGTTVYSFSVKNFGGAAALLDLSFMVSVPDGAGSGTVTYGGSTGPQGASSEPAIGDDCIASGCTVTWSGVSVGIGSEVSFTMTIVYDNAADGTRIQADLGATYTVDPSDGFVRTASGAPATIIFTIQDD